MSLRKLLSVSIKFIGQGVSLLNVAFMASFFSEGLFADQIILTTTIVLSSALIGQSVETLFSSNVLKNQKFKNAHILEFKSIFLVRMPAIFAINALIAYLGFISTKIIFLIIISDVIIRCLTSFQLYSNNFLAYQFLEGALRPLITLCSAIVTVIIPKIEIYAITYSALSAFSIFCTYFASNRDLDISRLTSNFLKITSNKNTCRYSIWRVKFFLNNFLNLTSRNIFFIIFEVLQLDNYTTSYKIFLSLGNIANGLITSLIPYFNLINSNLSAKSPEKKYLELSALSTVLYSFIILILYNIKITEILNIGVDFFAVSILYGIFLIILGPSDFLLNQVGFFKLLFKLNIMIFTAKLVNLFACRYFEASFIIFLAIDAVILATPKLVALIILIKFWRR